jgi:hypothetical protein
MAVIDDRGRLFGRVNIIDAAVGGFLLVLLPLAYGAYLLFQEPEPRLLSIEPVKVTPATTFVRIRGENLRPYLRVSFNEFQGVSFALVNPTTAEVRVPEMPAGTYDVILYDVAREASRLAKAVTVEAAVFTGDEAPVLVAGEFISLKDDALAELQPGAQLTVQGGRALQIAEVGSPRPDTRILGQPDATVLELPVSNARRLAALLRGRCQLAQGQCVVANADVQTHTVWSMFAPSGRPVAFRATEVFADGPTADVDILARLVVPGESARLVRAGDRDHNLGVGGTRIASISAITGERRLSADGGWRLSVPWSTTGEWPVVVQDGAAVIEARLHVTLDVTSDGMRYRGRVVRAGAPFVFETDRYILRGWVLDVQPAAKTTN